MRGHLNLTGLGAQLLESSDTLGIREEVRMRGVSLILTLPALLFLKNGEP